MKQKNTSIDQMLSEFSLEPQKLERRDRRAITIWVSVDTAIKYEELQGRTKKGFSKLLREAVSRMIEKVDEKKLAA